MHNFANTVLWVYIVLLVVGGLMGFLKAKSKVSLIMSVTFAALLALCAVGAVFKYYMADIFLAVLLVVFAIRTRRRFFESRPHRLMIVMAFGVVALASVLPFLPMGSWFGFVTPPPLFYIYLISVTIAYLVLVEIVKQVFYRFIAER